MMTRFGSTRLSNTFIAAAALALAAVFAGQMAIAQSLPAYTLNAGDEIEVSVWKEPELQKLILIRPDGKFSFPLVGEITAIDRTVAQVTNEITTKLKTYIPEPVVSVTVKTIGGNKAFVIGQVNNPGAFDMNPRITVLQALSLAGGMTPFASANNIVIIRRSDKGEQMLPFRFEEVSKGRNLAQNILLEGGDVIVVP